MPYGLIPGRLFEALKDEFPKAVELPLAKLPVDFGPEHVVRHRFLSQDGSRMFQVGVGVLSINHVGYSTYSAFSEDCRRVLSAAVDVGTVGPLQRIALQYINTARLDREWNNVITLRVQAPEVLEASAVARLHRWLSVFDEVGILSTTVAWPTTREGQPESEQEPDITLDFDHYNEQPGDFSVDDMLIWLHKAHRNIYTAFKSSLVPEYFRELEGGSNDTSTR